MAEQAYIDRYNQWRTQLMQNSSEVMNNLRDEAIRQFELQGFPTTKNERYKYMNVAHAFEGEYDFRVNKFQPSKMQSVIDAHYGQLADIHSDAITALNTAFSQNCLWIHVEKNQRVGKPIEISDILSSETNLMEHKRIVIVMEENSEASVLFRYLAQDKSKFLTTQVVEVFVGDGARLHLYELEETHLGCTRFNNVYARVGRDAMLHHNNISLFNGRTRNTINVALEGEYSNVTLNGCVMGDKSQQVDNNTLIDHKVPNCESHELYKYIVNEQAVGAFAGKVLVREGAQKTISNEVNQNLCASNEARMYTQPMLEIYADDVKCSHGSTIGKLDEAALFYMRQRGIPLAEAKMLLMQSFIGQVVDEIPLAPLRARLRIMVEKRLRGELDKCIGCSLCK